MWKTNSHKFKPDHGGLLVSYDKVSCCLHTSKNITRPKTLNL